MQTPLLHILLLSLVIGPSLATSVLGQTSPDSAQGKQGEEKQEEKKVSPKRVQRLIRQLGDNRFEKREEAQEELADLGLAAFEQLRAATHDDDLEIATRARYLLRLITLDLSRPDDSVEVVALLDQFHLLKQGEQIARLEKLAALPDGQGIAALCRVIRFEQSVVLAKQAALAMLKRYPSEKVPLDRLAKLLRYNLGNTRSVPSRWMLSYAKFHNAPREAWQEWDKWMQQERKLLDQEDQNTQSQIVSDLALQQVDWAIKMGGTQQQLVDKIHVLLEVRGNRQEDLKPLVTWLVEQKAWDVLKKPARDFTERLAGDPRSLVYDLANKYIERDQNALAEKAAEKAFLLKCHPSSESQRIHCDCAEQLMDKGRFKWAEREYRHVMRSGDMEDPYVHEAYNYLAAMFHDQGENQRAAQTLEKYINEIKQYRKSAKKKGDLAITDQLANYVTARMDYYLACHYRDAGQPAKQRLALEAGLAIDSTNPDLLIAAYNLPNTDPVQHKYVGEMVQKAALKMRMRVVADTDRATACNDLAWLIANTTGNIDEAIRLSKDSLREQPNNGAFHDTLARCYFTKGDYEKAVAHQIKAVELMPHSGLIVKQLELLRKTYEQKLGKPAPKPGQTKK